MPIDMIERIRERWADADFRARLQYSEREGDEVDIQALLARVDELNKQLAELKAAHQKELNELRREHARDIREAVLEARDDAAYDERSRI
jgi:hypothetical protein